MRTVAFVLGVWLGFLAFLLILLAVITWIERRFGRHAAELLGEPEPEEPIRRQGGSYFECEDIWALPTASSRRYHQ